MKNMNRQLQKLIPIPESPIDISGDGFKENCVQLGIDFPTDYVEFSGIYGSGATCVGIEGDGGDEEEFCPTYRWENFSVYRIGFKNYVDDFFERWDAMREGGDETSFGLFPEKGGLLPFGGRDDVYFTWRTIGKSSNWNVVVMWGFDENDFQEFDMGFSEFLYQLLMKKIEIEGFEPGWNPKTEINFETEVYSFPA